MSDTEVDVVERLFAEFEHVHALPTITAVVHQAYKDLHDAPAGWCLSWWSAWPVNASAPVHPTQARSPHHAGVLVVKPTEPRR